MKELPDSFEAIRDPGETRDQINLEPVDMTAHLSGLSNQGIQANCVEVD